MLGQSVFTHERDVGSTDRIGIAVQREAHISDKDRARTGQVDVLVQPEREVCQIRRNPKARTRTELASCLHAATFSTAVA